MGWTPDLHIQLIHHLQSLYIALTQSQRRTLYCSRPVTCGRWYTRLLDLKRHMWISRSSVESIEIDLESVNGNLNISPEHLHNGSESLLLYSKQDLHLCFQPVTRLLSLRKAGGLCDHSGVLIPTMQTQDKCGKSKNWKLGVALGVRRSSKCELKTWKGQRVFFL